MKLFDLKLYLTIIFAIVIAGIFFYVNESNESLLLSHADVLHQLTDVELHNEKISEEALNSAYRLYETYDTINRQLQQIRIDVISIKQSTILQDALYKDVIEQLNLFIAALDAKEKAIQKFATLNSLIKNSATHVPSMTSRYLDRFGFENEDYLLEISKITFSIFQARNAMDADLIAGIDDSLDYLESIKFDDRELERFNQVFLSHARVMQRYLPAYLPVFEEIINNPMGQLLHQVQDSFIQISSQQAGKLRTLSNFISLVFVSSVLFIIYLFFNLEKSRVKQLELTRKLEKRAMTDRLTSLSNRFAFEHEENQLIENSALLLINVDGFKNINDFYGRQVGDEFLKYLSLIISHYKDLSEVHQVYRVGADEFGVLVSTTDPDSLSNMANVFIEEIESTTFSYQDVHLGIQVSVGMSTVSPLLEKADIALRQIKSTRNKFMLYDSNQSLEEQAKANLSMMHFIREAIDNDYIEPHFMPIMNNSDQSIVGFECLIRLRDKDGRLYYPGEFLHIAKQGRLYGKLTRKMFDMCMSKFAHNDFQFSINISIDDIEDHEVTDFIIEKLQQFPAIGERLTLEVLESEGVKNYSVLQSFVERVKVYGCKIAIDDYGTGYSNLQHLVKLKVDSLKLDGSLIEPMISDVYSFVAVKAIVEMAQDLGIRTTTAEFVSSEKILQMVKSLDISQSQGFYIGRGSAQLSSQPEFKSA